MALKEVTRDYEILVRFNEDGSLGVHKQKISEILKDGRVVAASLLAPEELTVEEVLKAIEGYAK